MTADENYRLLMEIDANRRFMLLAYQSNPRLLAHGEPELRALFDGAGIAAGAEMPATGEAAVSPRLTFPAARRGIADST